MKQYKWLLLIIYLMIAALWLAACTFSFEVLPTTTSAPPTVLSVLSAAPPILATPTVAAPTTIPISTTPTLASITKGTIPWLETFENFELPDVVRSLAFTPDGTVLATAIGNFESSGVYLWDVVNGQSLGPLEGHTDIVWDVKFSPDGELLASVSSDKTAKIWDWRNKTLLKSLDFPGEVVSVRFSPDGQTLAVGGVDSVQNQIQNAAIWTYSVGSWELIRKFSEYMNIIAMAYSPKGGVLIGGGTSRNVQVWNADNGDSIFTLNHAHQVFQAVISPDGSTVATATCETVVYPECADGGVWLWNLPSGKLLRKLTGFPNFVENVAFTADGSSLVVASRDGTVRFYDTSNYEPLFELNLPGGVSALVVSPDGRLLGTGYDNRKVSLWKIVSPP